MQHLYLSPLYINYKIMIMITDFKLLLIIVSELVLWIAIDFAGVCN